MLLLIVGLIFGIWLFNRAPRLEAADASTTVRAYVDGKRVDSYVKENRDER